MAACRYCGTPVGFGATRCNTETCYLRRINELESALAERGRRVKELEDAIERMMASRGAKGPSATTCGLELPQRPQDSDGSGREGKDPDSEP